MPEEKGEGGKPLGNIGIIAGSGQFPLLVARAVRAGGAGVFICGFEEQTGEELEGEADEFIRIHIGQLGRLLSFFKKNEVAAVCLAGAIKKSRALNLRPDLRAARLLFKLYKNHGDDAILRAVLEELQAEGLEVVPASAFVPDLLGPAGTLSRRKPGPEEWKSIRHGWGIGKSLGAYDIGQCLVLRKNMVVAVEALEGTDAVLERGGELGGEGCVALKMLKPGQDTRVDLPSVGLETIRILTRLRYACLAYEAGSTLFFDRSPALALADGRGLAVVGLRPEDLQSTLS
ncbi:MAG: UDP-2,3-diacylglucosamine diphosphatase LpxI [Deltaproteobacteria bacterium]|jgi:DUF1009 family protein|nr:UDP-2,3-diacylglucosamine diphosphatase LpxI [Deltaproteobacteria bacterium]